MSAESTFLLTVENLTKSYERTELLHDLSFSVKKGEVVVVLGPSGSGKSTLLRSIDGLEEIDAGEIWLNGMDVSRKKGEKDTNFQNRKKMGMVFQSYELFPHLSILENITLAMTKVQKRNKKEAEKEARELLKRVGLLDKEKAYPRMLSGGQKQRVAIVRALAMHPEFMLFDEVTAALDPEMVREVLDVIMELSSEGQTMLMRWHLHGLLPTASYLWIRGKSWKRVRRTSFLKVRRRREQRLFWRILPLYPGNGVERAK